MIQGILIIVLILVTMGAVYYLYDIEKRKPKKKKVRFNKNVKYFTYSNSPVSTEVKQEKSIVSNHKEFLQNIERDYDEYNRSAETFHSFLEDDSNIIKEQIIDPFDKRNINKFSNKTIQEIYDQQIKEFSFRPKKIKKITENAIEYHNDFPMNSGINNEIYSIANFSNQF
jgi:hypothetical protein